MATLKQNKLFETTRLPVTVLPSLAKQDITIYKIGEGFGCYYSARVVEVINNRLRITLPRQVAGHGYLRRSGPVQFNFVYKRDLFEAPAEYIAEDEFERELVVSGEIVKSNRRRYSRMPLKVTTGYAPVSDLSITGGNLSGLKWKQCATIDLAGGGVMIQTPISIPVDSYFLLNLSIETFDGPMFVFGRVCWNRKLNVAKTEYQCGIKFLIAEELGKHFSKRALEGLPQLLLQFNEEKQIDLDVHLLEISGRHKVGDKYE